MIMRAWNLYIAVLLLPVNILMAQDGANTEAEYDSLYAVNIKLSKINGVYIPTDLEDAHKRVMALSPKSSLDKFATGEEVEVSRKLHFGIGRWMIVNWNFYGGSRFSHYLKQKSLHHPDDMAQFVLRTLHRKLNNKPLDEEQLIEELLIQRKAEVEAIFKN